MARSANIYTGDGATTNFAVNFTLGFISRSDVVAYVEGELDGSLNQVYRTIVWINDGLITLSPAPADTKTVWIRRKMDKTILQHDFQDGAIQNETSLDESNLQLLYIIHEILDGFYNVSALDLAELLLTVKDNSLMDTYTELRGQSVGYATVGGRDALGDGGGGVFYWNSSNLSTEVSADPQGGIYVAPTSDPTGASGAWVRQYTGYTNPLWFGADPTGGVTSFNALLAAQAIGDGVELTDGSYLIDSDLTLSGLWSFKGGQLKWGALAVVTFDHPKIIADKVQIFDVTPDWINMVVDNTTVDYRYAQNVVGPSPPLLDTNYGEWMHPEWFGAVKADPADPIDSYDACQIAHQVGNLHLSTLYYISRPFMQLNNKIVEGEGGRPTLYGFVVSPTLIPFTGTRGLTNFEDTGIVGTDLANGINQNPYTTTRGFVISCEGVNDAEFVPFHFLNLEGSEISQFICQVIPYGVVTVPSVKNLGHFRYGPLTIENCEIFTPSQVTISDAYAWRCTEMTNMVMTAMNYVGICAVPPYFRATTPSAVIAMNNEIHPSEGGGLNTTPQIIARGPVMFESVQLSTKTVDSTGFQLNYSSSVTYEAKPSIYDCGTSNHPADGTGVKCYDIPIVLIDDDGVRLPKRYERTYLFGTGYAQGAASLYGITSFSEGRALFYGGAEELANNSKQQDAYYRQVGDVGAGSTFSTPFPKSQLNDANSIGLMQGTIQISGRDAGGLDAGYYAVYYMEGNNTANGLLRLSVLVGSDMWTITADAATQLFTALNHSVNTSQDTIVSITSQSAYVL